MSEANGDSVLAGQVAVVTGGASGIGLRTAVALERLGADVYRIDRSFAPGPDDHQLHCDLADVGSIAATIKTVHDSAGRIDVLVNCAGIVGPKAGVADTSEEGWDIVMTVNLKSVVFVSQAAIPFLIEGDRRGARIVNVSSASAHRTRAHSVAYSASKAGVEAVTRILAGELAPWEVNVNAVAPGITATAIFAGDTDEARAKRASEGTTSNLFERVADPDDIANVIAFLCTPKSRQITGQVVQVSAGAIV